MRGRVILGVLGVVLVVVGTLSFLRLRGGAKPSSRSLEAAATADSGGGLRPQVRMSGSVEVTVEPVRFDAGEADFAVSFNTHSGSLGLDPATTARLVVGDVPWTAPSWEGPGPGGHHRSGTLRFRAAGPLRGTARLTIEGLPEPVVMTWTVSP